MRNVPTPGVIVHVDSGCVPSDARVTRAREAVSWFRNDVRSAHWDRPRTVSRTSERSMAVTASATNAHQEPPPRLESRGEMAAEENARVITSLK